MFETLEKNAAVEFEKWNICAIAVQLLVFKSRTYFVSRDACVKEKIYVRFFNNPITESSFPTHQDVNRLVQIEGIVISLSKKGYVEYAQEYTCKKCNSGLVIHGEYGKHFSIKPPAFCSKNQCNGQMFVKPNVSFKKYAHAYQELFLEELDASNQKTRQVTVTLEDDLIDCCNLGDDVIIVGTVENRQKPVSIGKVGNNTYPIKANSIRRKEKKVDSLNIEEKFYITDTWDALVSEKGEFGARDYLLQSLMPELYCMCLPKLAIALALCSCVESTERSHVHLLLVGEPGLAKSKLLERAVELSPKGFFAGGYRVSKAGLTAGVSKVDGEDIYEAGILPLCDGGVCAIDEFNVMAEDDKSAIHEAMEQQTISLTKV